MPVVYLEGNEYKKISAVYDSLQMKADIFFLSAFWYCVNKTSINSYQNI